MKLKLMAAAALVALSATAQAVSFSTFDGGAHKSPEEVGLDTAVTGTIFNEYEFTLSGTFDVTTSFHSNLFVGSVGLYKSDDTPVWSWGVGGTAPFTSASTFSLGAGSYYYAVIGKNKGGVGGFNLTSSAVAAVPEPETYALLGAGLGVIGFVASRRRRD